MQEGRERVSKHLWRTQVLMLKGCHITIMQTFCLEAVVEDLDHSHDCLGDLVVPQDLPRHQTIYKSLRNSVG